MQKFMDHEVEEDEFYNLQMQCWSKFYASAVQYDQVLFVYSFDARIFPALATTFDLTFDKTVMAILVQDSEVSLNDINSTEIGT